MIAPPLRPRGVSAVGTVRSRRTFDALHRSSVRGRSGPITVMFVVQKSWSRTEVAYAISRQVGSAVVRNRLRRRLRSIMAETAPSLPVGAYGIRAGAGAPELGFGELRAATLRALAKAASRAAVAAAGPETSR